MYSMKHYSEVIFLVCFDIARRVKTLCFYLGKFFTLDNHTLTKLEIRTKNYRGINFFTILPKIIKKDKMGKRYYNTTITRKKLKCKKSSKKNTSPVSKNLRKHLKSKERLSKNLNETAGSDDTIEITSDSENEKEIYISNDDCQLILHESNPSISLSNKENQSKRGVKRNFIEIVDDKDEEDDISVVWTSQPKKKPKHDRDNKTENKKNNLREIIVDGCNIAMEYTRGKYFSEEGLKLIIDYFESRGHIVKVFVPQDKRAKHRQLLEKWYNDGIVIFTPSRYAGGRRITPYDDRYILDYATRCNGVVISLDQYRDLYHEKPEWRDTIKNRLMAPTFVNDYVMFPEDPLGKNGPSLHTFLNHC